jgi:hypothetical protein
MGIASILPPVKLSAHFKLSFGTTALVRECKPIAAIVGLAGGCRIQSFVADDPDPPVADGRYRATKSTWRQHELMHSRRKKNPARVAGLLIRGRMVNLGGGAIQRH